MMPEEESIQKRHYLLGRRDIKELTEYGKLRDASEETVRQISTLTHKEIAMRSEGLVVVDSKDRIIYREENAYLQHFFPVLIRDFAELAYEYVKFNRALPILSIDSHDVIGCDFHCQDCLSEGGGRATKAGINIGFNPILKNYLHILSEIAAYSKRRGIASVRFEQSGEGNPDLYAYRPRLIEKAKKCYNMQTVYVTSGSRMSDELAKSLVENAAFIRISFPGINEQTYARYSKQEEYTFSDSVSRIEKLIKMRTEAKRERELLIGVRVALRPEEDALYYDFGRLMKEMKVDCMQLTKVQTTEGLNYRDFPISPIALRQFEMLKMLSDEHFNVSLPDKPNYLYCERVIDDRCHFTDTCYSSRIQPVLSGNGLFACTEGDVMYSKQYLFGRFEGKKGEIEEFLSDENVNRVTKNVPASCDKCENIFDNTLFDTIVKLTRHAEGPLFFYEAISC
jgi:sulfatase maturation enzyme AslB (radical SAM superfamily)